MNTNFKSSRYNYHQINEQNELILYNTLRGTPSLCKFKNATRFASLLNSGIEIPEDGTVPLDIQQLIDKGFLIESWKDECNILTAISIAAVSPKNLSLILVPMNDCCFRCVYCWERFDKSIMSDLTQENIINFIKRNISQYTGVHVSWFGGEPLMALDIIENISSQVIDICKRHKKPYTSNMITNGYLLNLNTFKRLQKCNVLSYQVSLDGLKETHDKQRPLINGKGSYETIVNNLVEISSHIKSSMYKFTIRSCTTAEMVEDIPEILKYFSNNFGHDARFSIFFYPVKDMGGASGKSMKNSAEKSMQIMEDVYKAVLSCAQLPRLQFKGYFEPTSGICHAGKQNNFLIAPNGEVHTCPLTYEDPIKKSKSRIGCLDEKGMLKTDTYLQSLWLYTHTKINCKNYNKCFFAPACGGGVCSARFVFSKSSDPDASDCLNWHKQSLSEILKIFDRQGYIPTID